MQSLNSCGILLMFNLLIDAMKVVLLRFYISSNKNDEGYTISINFLNSRNNVKSISLILNIMSFIKKSCFFL